MASCAFIPHLLLLQSQWTPRLVQLLSFVPQLFSWSKIASCQKFVLLPWSCHLHRTFYGRPKHSFWTKFRATFRQGNAWWSHSSTPLTALLAFQSSCCSTCSYTYCSRSTCRDRFYCCSFKRAIAWRNCSDWRADPSYQDCLSAGHSSYPARRSPGSSDYLYSSNFLSYLWLESVLRAMACRLG